jgi:hypothetical protein
MAFSFVVEDGTNLPTATSYVSVAAADDYFEIDRAFSATWSALTTEEKEYRLAWATRILDQKVRWNGIKDTQTQGLEWPRRSVYDRNDVAISDNIIPEQLVEATLELAKYVNSNDPISGSGVDFVKSIVLDVLEIEYQEGTSQNSFPNVLNSLLRGLGHYPIPGQFSFNKISKA